jgi:PilZ domain-containing protein
MELGPSVKPGTIPRRREMRLPATLEVRVLGIDAAGNPFHQSATTLDISPSGARITGITAKLKQGDVVGLQSGGNKNRFQVAWIIGNRDGTNELGMQCMERGASPWRERLRPKKPEGTERRAVERYSCNGSASLRASALPAPIWGRIRDISTLGCYVQSEFVASVGDTLSGQFTISGVQLNAVVEVRSSMDSVGMGLAWCDLGCDGEVRLERILRSLSSSRVDTTNGRVTALAQLDKLRQLMATLRERLEDDHYTVKPQLVQELDQVQEQLTAALRSVQP